MARPRKEEINTMGSLSGGPTGVSPEDIVREVEIEDIPDELMDEAVPVQKVAVATSGGGSEYDESGFVHFDGGYKGRRVRVMVMNGSLPHEKGDVPISVNGHTILIKREVPVDIPYPHYQQLLVKEKKYFPGETEGEWVETMVPRFNVQVLNPRV